jgi:hypothetical protein
MNKYYTYAYLREDGTPYYIGKGKGNRIYRKDKRIRPPKNRSRIIFLKQNLTEEESFKHEIYMISIFGRKDLETGILLNKTNGGEGSSGFVHSKESIGNISKSKKGCSAWNKGKKIKNIDDLSYSGKYKRGIVGKKQPKYREFINPDGKLVVIENIKKFCLENNLCYSHMLKVYSGILFQHKGWTEKKLAQDI